MAIIKCKDCGNSVSSNAATCPHCGCPVPKKMVSVVIERASTIAMAVNCYVYLDGSMRGELKPGKIMTCQLPVGIHHIQVESDVRSFGHSAADTKSASGEQFEILEKNNRVHILVKTKGSWTGGVGKCVVESIICR